MSRLLESRHGAGLISAYGRKAVTACLRTVLQQRRDRLVDAETVDVSAAAILADAEARLAKDNAPSLRPVFNLTGTVLHTNLGRAFLPEAAVAAVARIARGASNLEYDLEAGRRGDRDDHVERQIAAITGAEAATVVNNNAAAVMLVLNTLALGRQVAVSRGELVEIGGSFRIPDIMARSGCELVEVGTTNRTHLEDFANALGPDLAMIMKVHTSNYVIAGFTAAVPEPELAKLCAANGIPFVNDLGSGTLANLDDYGLPHEPTPMDALRDGADVVTFSGDKLLGGPQSGLIVGRRDFIAQIKANPMKRALRCDKMTIAALAAVLKLYRDPDRLPEHHPVIATLTRKAQDIKTFAEDLAPAIETVLGGDWHVAIVACESEIGSGALPTRTVASFAIAVRPAASSGVGRRLQRLSAAFRRLPVPVIGRIQDDAFVMDLRCLAIDDRQPFLDQLRGLEAIQ